MIDHPTAKAFVVVWLSHPEVCHEICVCVCVCVCVVVFVCTFLWSAANCLIFSLNKGLKQWPYKQYQRHSTCLLALTHKEIKYCPRILSRPGWNIYCTILIKGNNIRQNIERLGAASETHSEIRYISRNEGEKRTRFPEDSRLICDNSPVRVAMLMDTTVYSQCSLR